MKKLKVYKKVDFRFVEVQLEGAPIAGTQPAGREDVTDINGEYDGTEDADKADAPIFRGGIWDED